MDEPKRPQLNVALTSNEERTDVLTRIESLKKRIQRYRGPYTLVTTRIVILEALDELEKKLDRLDRDRERKR